MEKQIKRLKWLFIILGTQRFKVGQWEAFKNAKGGLFVNFGGHFKVTVFWFINLLYVIKGATFQGGGGGAGRPQTLYFFKIIFLQIRNCSIFKRSV